MLIACEDKKMELEQGMTVEQCLIKLGVSREGVLAVQQGGRVLEMNAPVTQPGLLHLLTMHTEEGRRIYERSVRFLLLAATNRILPGQRVRIEYSVSGGVLLRMPGHAITEEETRAIAQQMHALAAQNLPFEKKEWTLDDAIAYFDAQGQADKVTLLSRRTTPFFHMYGLDCMWEYFYGAMATRTGMTQVFELTWLPDRGIVLRLPAANHPEKAAPYVHRAGHLAVFDQSTRWCALLGVNNAADVAEMMEGHRFRHFIRLNEALHDKAIADIAADIAIQHKKIVLVAGPSSSGKTTFAQRLALHLNVIGLQPLVISLDNYYLDRDSIPLQEDGTLDLEAISTLDVPLFRQHLAELLDGREVLLPTFSFKLGKRNPGGTPVRLREGQVMVIEGIHGLNPALSEGLHTEAIYRVFVSALTCLNLDDHNRIRTTDVRLLRRIVRDMQFRATPPNNTLSMWPSVRHGEETWIFPYQENADRMFNTALHYELPVLRHYAYDLLKAIPPENENYLAARRLIKTLNYFPDIDEGVLAEIPPLSLLREFIGGCTIEEA